MINPITIFDRCYTISDINRILDEEGVPRDDEIRMKLLLVILSVYPHRKGGEYPDSLTFEDVAKAIILSNIRERSIPPLPPPGTDLWRISAITFHDGSPRMDSMRRCWVDYVVMILILKLGYGMRISFILNPDGEFVECPMRTSRVVEIDRKDDIMIVKTRNDSIYRFERLKDWEKLFGTTGAAV